MTEATMQYERPRGLGVRHAQTFLLFAGMLLAFTMRANMSIAIVGITNANMSIAIVGITNANMSIAIVGITNDNKQTDLQWDASIQSVVLSSFFWGYVILQIPGGIMASRVGGKVLLTISIGVNSVISLLLPFGATLGGWKLVCGCRFLQGLTQAFVYPATHQLVSKWIPLEEKGLLTTIIYAGGQLGIALQLMIGGFVASAWGWPAIFYTNGTLGLLWTIAYIYLGAISPEKSKLISLEEVEYIQKSLGKVSNDDGKQKPYPIPWAKILTSVPFWAVIVAHCGQNWGFFTLMTEMPSYMFNVMHVDLKTNGVLTSLPYLAMYVLSFPMGAMTDLIIRKKWMAVASTRKLSNSIGFWGSAIALIGLSYVPPSNIVMAVTILTLTVGLNAGHYTGFLLGHIDLAPNYSATLMGITNFLANIISIIAPLVCGFIVTDLKDATQWRIVFFVSAGVYFCTNLFFITFNSSKKQKWNEPETNTDTQTMKTLYI